MILKIETASFHWPDNNFEFCFIFIGYCRIISYLVLSWLTLESFQNYELLTCRVISLLVKSQAPWDIWLIWVTCECAFSSFLYPCNVGFALVVCVSKNMPSQIFRRLSRNKLSGQIPRPVASLTGLSFLYVFHFMSNIFSPWDGF